MGLSRFGYSASVTREETGDVEMSSTTMGPTRQRVARLVEMTMSTVA